MTTWEEAKKVIEVEHALGVDHIPINHYWNDEKGEWNKTPYRGFSLEKHYSYEEYSTLEQLEHYAKDYKCNTFAIRLGKLRDREEYIIGIDCDSAEYARLIDYALREEGLDTMKETTPREGMHFYFITDDKDKDKENSTINIAEGTPLDIKLYYERRYFLHIGNGYHIINSIDKIRTVKGETLKAITSLLARLVRLCYALSGYYNKGQRDYLWFYLSGLMCKSGIALEEALKICRYTCHFFNDEEVKSRLAVVEETYSKGREDKGIKGYAGLQELGLPVHILHDIFGNDRSSILDNLRRIGTKEYMFVVDFLLEENRQQVDRALFVNDYRYVYERDGEGYWIEWHDGVWSAEYALSSLADRLHSYCMSVKEEIEQEMKKYADDDAIRKELEGYRDCFLRVIKSKASINELIDTLSIRLYITDNMLDNLHGNVILCRNCAIEIAHNEVKTIPLEQIKWNYPTRRLNVNYDPDAKCDRFREFLITICNGDIEKANFLIRLMGLFLQRRKEEYCFIFYGAGANGKSTLLKVITSLLGDYARYSNISLINAREEEGKNPELISACNKNLICVFEPKQIYLNTANLKAITSLEPKSVRPLYSMPIEVVPDFHLVIATNNKPIITEFTLGMLRRLVMIKFDYIVPEDKRIANYADILLEERSGILNLMIAGLQAVMQEGRLKIPDIVKRETAEWIYELDILQEFIDRYLVMTYNDRDMLEFSVVYERFKFFAQLKGKEQRQEEQEQEEPIMTKQEFSKRIKDKGFTTTRIKKVTYICRAKWKADADFSIFESDNNNNDSGSSNNTITSNNSSSAIDSVNTDNTSTAVGDNSNSNGSGNSGNGSSSSNSNSNNNSSGSGSGNNTINIKERRVWRISELQPVIKHVQQLFVDIEGGYRCRYCDYTHKQVTLYNKQVKIGELHTLPDLILHVSNPLLVAMQELLEHVEEGVHGTGARVDTTPLPASTSSTTGMG